MKAGWPLFWSFSSYEVSERMRYGNKIMKKRVDNFWEVGEGHDRML